MTREELPIPDSPRCGGMCAWCDEDAVGTIELAPAQFSHQKGVGGKRIKIMKKAALVAPVCRFHAHDLFPDARLPVVFWSEADAA